MRNVDKEGEINDDLFAMMHYKDKIFYLEEQIKKWTNIVQNPQKSTCHNFSSPYVKVKVLIGNCYFVGLHHIYLTPFLGMRVMRSYFLFDMYVDHDFIETKLGKIWFYDLTNWPFSVDPERIQSKSDLPPEKEIIGFYDED